LSPGSILELRSKLVVGAIAARTKHEEKPIAKILACEAEANGVGFAAVLRVAVYVYTIFVESVGLPSTLQKGSNVHLG
jgi:hypothetical protein